MQKAYGWLMIFALVLGVLLAGVSSASAEPKPGYKLNLELRSPVYNTQFGRVENLTNLEMAGGIQFVNLWGKKGPIPWIRGEHTFQQDVFKPENKLLLGLDVPLGRDVTFTTYWREDFQYKKDNVGRIFVGLRYNCSGTFE